MLREEFERKTGFFPSSSLYKIIEKHYMDFDGNQDAFCKAYKANANGIAQKIQHEADLQKYNAQCEAEKQLKDYEAQIAELKRLMEREQEWKPYEDTDNVSQSDYIGLQTAGGTRVLSDDAAKDLLYEWYGFAREKIKILHAIPIYEVNRHRQLRKIKEIQRDSLYNATDWNYIRFDCSCVSYEFFNGNLRPYLD